MVRTTGDPLTLAASVRSAVRMVDPDQPVTEMRTLDELISRSVSNRTFEAVLFGTFAGCSLLLATLGVFSLLSWFVAQRIREIGVRIALGATAQNVLYLMLGRAAVLIGLGLLIGSVGALVTTRLLQSFLFGVKPTDPVSFAAAVLALVAAGVLAAALPAWRALRVDPAAALRVE
jgi:ABC-type antimicrobial peptide transport system permease subunit